MRISSIECGRVLAILAVMTIHLSPFSNPFDPTLWDGTPYLWLGAIINQLCRFAVPLFFLCAGYFLQPALAAGKPMAVALRYCNQRAPAKDCRIVGRAEGGCVALALETPAIWGGATRATRAEAEAVAKAKCRQEGGRVCSIQTSFCN